MKLRTILLALLASLGCVALAGLPAAAGAHARPSKPGRKLRITSVKVGSRVGPLIVRVHSTGTKRFQLRVNGRRVPDAFYFSGAHTQVTEPRADALRPGTDKLQITGPGGARATRKVHVPGRFLTVEAGADLATSAKMKTTIGAPPAATGAPADTRYDWTIVSEPNEAKATLDDADGARPTLDPETPGTYVLQLEADPGSAPPVFDQVQVGVDLSAPPIGVPINTSDASKNGAIVIGGQVLGGNDGGIAYAVLQRTTGATLASGSVSSDTAGITQLQRIADEKGTTKNTYLMIISGRSELDEPAVAALTKLAESLGSGLFPEEDFGLLRSGVGFSVIGIPGAPAGAATVRIPGREEPRSSPAIVGYLEQNQAVDFSGSNVWEYVSPERPSFDTRAAGSTATHNVIKVEGKDPFIGDLPADVTAGFHVVALNSLTLDTLANVIVPTNGSGGNVADRGRQEAAAAKLFKLFNFSGHPLVLVQSVGNPKGAGPEWTKVANTFGRLGVNRQLVMALDGSTGYAVVDRVGSEAPPAESSTAYDRGPYGVPKLPPFARLVGSLARGRAAGFEPTVSSTPTDENPNGGVNLGLIKTVYQPLQDWPALPGPTAESKLAEEYICGQLHFCGTAAAECPTVRKCFWMAYSENWEHAEDVIGRMRFPETQTGFNKGTFEAVRQKLEEEAGDVATVKSYLATLRAPLERQQTRAYVDLQAIGTEIYDSVQRPPGTNSKAYALGLIGKAVAVGAFAGPPVSTAAAGLSATFGLAAYLSTEAGQPILGTEVKVKAQSLATDILDRVDAAGRTLRSNGLLMVSDYGKLTTAAREIRGNREWKPSDDQSKVEAQLRTGAKQWFYEALIPAAYPYLIRSPMSNARQANCSSSTGRQGWPNQPDVDQMQAITGYDNNGNPIRSVFFFTNGYGGGSSPTSTLGDKMFKPLTEGGLEMQKLNFFTPRVWSGEIFHALPGQEKCEVGFLPDRG